MRHVIAILTSLTMASGLHAKDFHDGLSPDTMMALYNATAKSFGVASVVASMRCSEPHDYESYPSHDCAMGTYDGMRISLRVREDGRIAKAIFSIKSKGSRKTVTDSQINQLAVFLDMVDPQLSNDDILSLYTLNIQPGLAGVGFWSINRKLNGFHYSGHLGSNVDMLLFVTPIEE